MRARREAILGLLPALALLAAGCGGEAGGSAMPARGGGPPAPVVEVLRLEPETLVDEAALLGQLEPEDSVMVRSEVPGILDAISFREGDRVEKGQVLFQLRDAEQRARLAEARAELRIAQDAFERTQGLARRDVVSAAQLERARAELEAAQARVDIARAELERMAVRAPFDGFAGVHLVSVGKRVSPEDDLVQVQALETLELAFTLPEQALPLARTGVPIELTVAPYPGERFPGEISFVAPGLNPQNRRLLVKARVPNPDLRLRPGLFARVEARLGEREDRLVLPADAVVQGSGGSFVWRLDDAGAVHPVDVALGARRDGRVEVESGLAPGDVVVVAGTHKLSPGMKVETVGDETAGGSAPADDSPPVREDVIADDRRERR